MAGNEVVIVVSGTDHTKPAFDGASKGVKGFVDEAKRANPELRKLDDEIKRAADSVMSLGKAMRDGRQVMTVYGKDGKAAILDVNTALVAQRKEMTELIKQRKELATVVEREAKQQASRLGLGDGKDTKRRGGILGLFADAAPAAAKAGADAASTFSSAFQSGIMSAFKSLPPEAQGAIVASLVGVATIAGPFIATALSGAILAALGGGVLAAGIALAFNTPAVSSAFSGVGDKMLQSLTKASTQFAGPLVQAAHTFGDAFADIMPSIESMFGTMAGTVGPLAKGLADMARESMPGIQKAVEAAAPMFVMIGNELPRIGAAMSSFFADVASAGPGATAMFEGIFHAIEGSVIVAGKFLALMGGIVGGAMVVEKSISNWMSGGSFDATTEELGHLEGKFLDVASAAHEAEGGAEGLANGLDELFNTTMDADEAATAWLQSLDDLKKALQDGKKTLDQHTQAGRDNVEALRDSVRAAQAVYEADVALHGVTEANTSAFNAQIDQIIATARAAGLNEAAVRALVEQYKKVPGNLATNIVLNGGGPVSSALQGITNLMNSLNGRTAVTHVVTNYSVTGNRTAGPVMGGFNAHGGIIGADVGSVMASTIHTAATGGQRGGMTWVGEGGPELVRLPSGSSVYSAGQSQAMAQRGEVGGSAGQHVIIEFKSNGSAFEDAMLGVIQKAIRIRGGNVQVVLGNGRSE
jgi:hypothetical protein